MSDALLNEKQAADFLLLTPRALQAWRTKGGGPPYVRVGHRTVRYLPADLEAWVGSRRFENTAQEGRYSTGSVV